MSDWQPIETAPRDGSKILGVVEFSAGGYRHFIFYWTKGVRKWVCFPGSGLGYDDDEIAGWMPLPEPPA